MKHIRRKGTIAGAAILALIYAGALLAPFLSPYGPSDQVRSEPSAPASIIRLRDEQGVWQRPFIYRTRLKDVRTFAYEEDRTQKFPVALFVKGSPYPLFGKFSAETHFFGTEGGENGQRVYLMGTDHLGRDRFSRLLHAARFSFLVSPIGTLLACLVGIAIGLISGYSRPAIDSALMGVTETMLSLPALIIVLAARAAFPPELPAFTASVLLISIFALVGWAEMARLTRSLVRTAREFEYVTAAAATGVTQPNILRRHILPNISGPLFTQASLMVPAFLLAEVSLSFLGVGLQEPDASLGNMLAAATDITRLQASPVLMLSPAVLIFIYVLAIRLAARGGAKGNYPQA